jgi:hypothetical protein
VLTLAESNSDIDEFENDDFLGFVHCFLKKGHTLMEVDSMHSSIEHAQKNASTNCMNDWMSVFHIARSKRKNKNAKPYIRVVN